MCIFDVPTCQIDKNLQISRKFVYSKIIKLKVNAFLGYPETLRITLTKYYEISQYFAAFFYIIYCIQYIPTIYYLSTLNEIRQAAIPASMCFLKRTHIFIPSKFMNIFIISANNEKFLQLRIWWWHVFWPSKSLCTSQDPSEKSITFVRFNEYLKMFRVISGWLQLVCIY